MLSLIPQGWMINAAALLTCIYVGTRFLRWLVADDSRHSGSPYEWKRHPCRFFHRWVRAPRVYFKDRIFRARSCLHCGEVQLDSNTDYSGPDRWVEMELLKTTLRGIQEYQE